MRRRAMLSVSRTAAGAFLTTGLLLAVGSAARAQEAGEEGRTKAQLKQALVGPDRDARREAFKEAMRRGGLDEQVWLRLLDQGFPTAEEEEESCYFAARGLAQTGTRRCLPRLHELMQRKPTVFRRYEGAGVPTMVPKYPYLSAAVLTYRELALRAPLEDARARLEELPAERQAELLAEWLADPSAGYATFRRPGEPHEEPIGWIAHLCGLLAELGPIAAPYMATAVEEVDEPERRGKIAQRFDEEFVSQPFEAFVEARYPELNLIEEPPRSERREEARVQFASQLPSAVREGATRIARTILRSHRQLAPSESLAVFRIIRHIRLVEVERELIAFLRRTKPSRYRHLRTKGQVWRHSAAAKALASLRTETAIDYLLRERGDDDLRWVLEPRDLAGRFVRALETAAATPWTDTFRTFARGAGNPARGRFVDPARLRAVRTRVSTVLESLDPDDREKRRAVESSLRILDRSIRFVTEANSDRGEGDSR